TSFILQVGPQLDPRRRRQCIVADRPIPEVPGERVVEPVDCHQSVMYPPPQTGRSSTVLTPGLAAQTVGMALTGAIATVDDVGRFASSCVRASTTQSMVGSPSIVMTQRSPTPQSARTSSLTRHTNSLTSTSRPLATPAKVIFTAAMVPRLIVPNG